MLHEHCNYVDSIHVGCLALTHSTTMYWTDCMYYIIVCCVDVIGRWHTLLGFLWSFMVYPLSRHYAFVIYLFPLSTHFTKISDILVYTQHSCSSNCQKITFFPHAKPLPFCWRQHCVIHDILAFYLNEKY